MVRCVAFVCVCVSVCVCVCVCVRVCVYVGTMLAVVVGYAPPEMIDASYVMQDVRLPKAPGLGLLLDTVRAHSLFYRARCADE